MCMRTFWLILRSNWSPEVFQLDGGQKIFCVQIEHTFLSETVSQGSLEMMKMNMNNLRIWTLSLWPDISQMYFYNLKLLRVLKNTLISAGPMQC